MTNIFPNIKNTNPSDQNLQIQTFGRRIFNSQTVQEYLLEFLIVFLGEKDTEDKSIGFLKVKLWDSEKITYLKNPNIGLKRFIFFDKTKLDSRFTVDIDADNAINGLLEKKIEAQSYSNETILNIIRDLLSGFSMFTGNRGWYAQSLMPICRETIFCEAIGLKAKRKTLSMLDDDGYFNIETDKRFEFNQYSFLARGGEVYYLHILQGLNNIKNIEGDEKAIHYRDTLEKLIINLVDTYSEFSRISKWIQNNWIRFISEKKEDDCSEEVVKKQLMQKGECKWIAGEYERRAAFSVKEIINLLEADINEFEKINLFSKGIVFQILRMMSEAAYIQSRQDINGNNRCWIIHFNSNNDADTKIKRLAVECYKEVEEDMMIALANKLNSIKSNSVVDETGIRKNKTDIQLLKDAYDDSYKLLRKLGKDIGIIVPLKGDNMRFTLCDDIIRFFVLALIPPSSKMTLDTFLRKLYNQFGIVIGPKQYNKYINDRGLKLTDASYLKYNLDEFQRLLKKNGFLKELSDATAMVINPYNTVQGIEGV
ncbi:hypothetical protein CPJCM30710_15050 [Clostridium polyendosporum]|uniref:Uncharacterized protein n=1 Tax=Clostridium polyendosporum TaxID=69208 RepID=A0A919RYZ0_9CLOT|nr:hypothetical protein [Clostridium polyendosporum]GIM28839.1 hypothetical protein CPJCM30710_15050 [Clostridium polyendosporum]